MQINVREKLRRISSTEKVIWIILVVTGTLLIGASIWLLIDTKQAFGSDYRLTLLITTIVIVLISVFGAINSTLSRENILNNPTRAKIYSLIESQPGIHLSQIIRNLKLGKGQADWHLFNLKRFELITQVRSEQYLLFYPNKLDVDMFIRHSTIFKSKTREQIFDLISTGSATTQNQMKEHLQLSQSSIAYHLGILEQENLIYAVKKKGIRHYFSTNNVQDYQKIEAN